ncbi:MAG: sigma-70 family RNA polymerase sigma factor [Planctomycetota bacterium]
MPVPHPAEETPSSDVDLAFARRLERARNGDAEAVDELFRDHYEEVRRTVHRNLERDLRAHHPWLGARFSTGDIVQEVFRSVLGELSSFEGRTERAFVGYLSMVVRNRLIDALRFHQADRRDGRRLQHGVEQRGLSDRAEPAADAAEWSESWLRVTKALATLPEREQLLLRARLEQNTSFRELADQLGYSSRFAARRAFYAAQARLLMVMNDD